MGYEIRVDDLHGIAEIRLADAFPHREHLKARDELLHVCRARGVHKILVDARDLVTQDRVTTMEIFGFGASWGDLARETRLLVAGVMPLDANTRDEVLFGDTVAVNRGLVARAFEDIAEARAWLHDGGT